LCLGFVSGFVGGVEWTSTSFERVAHAKPVVCVPERVTKGQLILVVVKELNDDPAHLHIDAGVLVFSAFLKNFPCHETPTVDDKPK
jgi:hypothetical protein